MVTNGNALSIGIVLSLKKSQMSRNGTIPPAPSTVRAKARIPVIVLRADQMTTLMILEAIREAVSVGRENIR